MIDNPAPHISSTHDNDELIDGMPINEHAALNQKNIIWRRINDVAANKRAMATITAPYISNQKICDCLVRFHKLIDRAYKVLDSEPQRVDILLDMANGCLRDLRGEMRKIGVNTSGMFVEVDHWNDR